MLSDVFVIALILLTLVSNDSLVDMLIILNIFLTHHDIFQSLSLVATKDGYANPSAQFSLVWY